MRFSLTPVWCQMPARSARIAMVTTAQQDLMGLRRELLPWMAYHLHIGISHFYVRAAFSLSAVCRSVLAHQRFCHNHSHAQPCRT